VRAALLGVYPAHPSERRSSAHVASKAIDLFSLRSLGARLLSTGSGQHACRTLTIPKYVPTDARGPVVDPAIMDGRLRGGAAQ